MMESNEMIIEEKTLDEMTLEELKACRAAVEVYGTASELYEVEMRIKELKGNH